MISIFLIIFCCVFDTIFDSRILDFVSVSALDYKFLA